MKFDNQNCRKAYSRWRAKMRECSGEAKRAIDCLAEYTVHESTHTEAGKRLVALYEYLEALNIKLVELELHKP